MLLTFNRHNFGWGLPKDVWFKFNFIPSRGFEEHNCEKLPILNQSDDLNEGQSHQYQEDQPRSITTDNRPSNDKTSQQTKQWQNFTTDQAMTKLHNRQQTKQWQNFTTDKTKQWQNFTTDNRPSNDKMSLKSLALEKQTNVYRSMYHLTPANRLCEIFYRKCTIKQKWR